MKEKEERNLVKMEKILENRRKQSVENEEKKERLIASIEFKQLRVIEKNREKSENLRKKNYEQF